jgi:hypothetical protein
MRSSNTLATSFSLSNCSNVKDSPWGVGYILWSMGEHQRYLISTQQSVLSLLSTVRYTFPPKCSITLEYLLFLICSTASSTSSKYVSNIFQRIKGKHISIVPCLRVISSFSAFRYTSPPRWKLECYGKHTAMSAFSGPVSTETNSFLWRANRA